MATPELDLDYFKSGQPNLAHWLEYTDPLPVPNSWRILTWAFTVGAACQRRIWYGQMDYKPLFINPYMLFVGVPATGKSFIMGCSKEMLSHHPARVGMYDPTKIKNERIPRLFNQGPDSTTFESIIEKFNDGLVRWRYMENGSTPKTYIYRPIWLILSEIDSLLHREAGKIGPLLRMTYDCEDYSYETKTAGNYYVHNPCMAFLAGTQPSKLDKLYKLDAFSDGMASRCIFAYEKPTDRGDNEFFLPNPTERMLTVCRPAILEHLDKLSRIFGKAQYYKKTQEWLDVLWRDEVAPKLRAANELMSNHYSRYKVNVMKLAAAFHLSDSLELVISDESFHKAVTLMAYLEDRMAESLVGTGRNALAQYIPRITALIQSRKNVAFSEVVVNFTMDMSLQEIESVVDTLIAAKKIRRIGDQLVWINKAAVGATPQTPTAATQQNHTGRASST